jgi:hypothetical protein
MTDPTQPIITAATAAAPAAAVSMLLGVPVDLFLAGFSGAFIVSVPAAQKEIITARVVVWGTVMLLASTVLAGLLGQWPAAWLAAQPWWRVSPSAAHHLVGGIIGLCAQGIIEFLQAIPHAFKGGLAPLVSGMFGALARMFGGKDGGQP